MPAVRGDPSIGDQSIFFAVLPRERAAKPAVGTIVAVEGGPGYASTNFDSAKSFRAVFGPLLRRRDLVLIDQRGTGHSQAVNCPQLQRGLVPEQIAVASCTNQLGARLGTAVECNDYPVAWDRGADFAQRTAQLDQAIAPSHAAGCSRPSRWASG